GPDAAGFDADRQLAFSSEGGRNPDRGPRGGAGQVRSGRERRPPAERPRMLPGSFTLLVVGRRPPLAMTPLVRPSVLTGALRSILLALALGTGTHASSDPRAAGRMARFSEASRKQPAVLVGAGDIASCADLSGAEATARLIDSIPGTVFTLGDHAYP